MDFLEPIAVISGIGSVVYSKQRHVLTYPVGLVSVLIYVWLCFSAGLYGDMSVNVFFAVLSVTGWIQWFNASNSEYVVAPEKLTSNEIKKYIFKAVLFFLLIYWVLRTYTDSSVPVIDGVVTTGSVLGMILMNNRKIEHWLVWIVVNTLSMPLFWMKGLPLTSLQFFVLLVFSVQGYREWKKLMH